jgi:hypothetical protein
MVTTGGDELNRLFKRLEELEAAEEQRVLGEMVERRVQLEVALRLKEREPELRRSQMTAADITRFIRSHPGGPAAGAAAYQRLPK